MGYTEKQLAKVEERPAPLTPYERMRWQQKHCTEDVLGYTVGLASDRTERAAYMTGKETELTNNEHHAAILPKAEASGLIDRLYTGAWYDKLGWKIAFLVPVSEDMPLTLCTFAGY
jgi:hypothetical protein